MHEHTPQNDGSESSTHGVARARLNSDDVIAQREAQIQSLFLNDGPIKPAQMTQKCYRICRIVYVALMGVIGAFMVICSSFGVAHIARVDVTMGSFSSNMHNSPIVSMRLATAADSGVPSSIGGDQPLACDEGEESVFLYEWPGSQSGCNCLNAWDAGAAGSGAKVEAIMYVGPCTKDMTNAGCQGASAMQPVPLINFDKDGQPLLICYKRLDGYPFYTSAPQGDRITCGDFTVCGGATAESVFCVPEDYPCPINEIIVSDTNPNPVLFNIAEAMAINSTHLIWVSRMSDKQAISELVVQEGDGVCFDSTRNNVSPGRKDYHLYPTSYQRNDGPCTDTDPRYTLTRRIGEKTYFERNGLADQIRQNLPDFELTDDYKYGAYFRHFIYWRVDLREKIAFLISIQDNIHSLIAFEIVVLVMNCVFFIFMSVGFGTIELCNIMNWRVPFITGESDENQPRIVYLKRTLNVAPKLLQLPFVVALFAGSTVVSNFLLMLAREAPSDEIMNAQLKTVSKDMFENVHIWNLVMFLAMLLGIIADCFRGGGYLAWLRSNRLTDGLRKIVPNAFMHAVGETNAQGQQQQQQGTAVPYKNSKVHASNDDSSHDNNSNNNKASQSQNISAINSSQKPLKGNANDLSNLDFTPNRKKDVPLRDSENNRNTDANNFANMNQNTTARRGLFEDGDDGYDLRVAAPDDNARNDFESASSGGESGVGRTGRAALVEFQDDDDVVQLA